MNENYSDFKFWKKQALYKLDKSNIGEIDEKIRPLCTAINKRDDMFTLSSCCGRITLIKDLSKTQNIWHFVSHKKIKPQDIMNSLNNYKEDTTLLFIQESVIIHICVKTNELARKLMHISKKSGLNQVGIIANRNKIVVELICDSKLELPIYENGIILINEEYLKILIKKANKNLEKSWNAIKNLTKEITNLK